MMIYACAIWTAICCAMTIYKLASGDEFFGALWSANAVFMLIMTIFVIVKEVD